MQRSKNKLQNRDKKMSSEQTYVFDPKINSLNQTIFGNHLINELRNQQEFSVDLCPFSLASSLSRLNQRYMRTILDIIVEYDIVNPPAIKTMGGESVAPYSGIYNKDAQTILFEVRNFPPSLIVMLYKFCTLIPSSINHHTQEVGERIRQNNASFLLEKSILEEAYKRVKPLEKSIKSGIKGSHDIINPGKPSVVNDAGGTSRILMRGEFCNKNGDPYNTNSSKPCWWHRHTFEGNAIGIPIYVKTIDNELKVYMDGVFCSYECALAYLEDELSKIMSRRDCTYSKSMPLLRQLYDEHFPGQTLHPAPDWRLLKDVGDGNLTVREFTEKLSSYNVHLTPSFSILPVTRYYELTKKA